MHLMLRLRQPVSPSCRRWRLELRPRLMADGAVPARGQSRGATEKKNRENDVHLRQLAKKSTYVPSFFFFFLVHFWAFLGKGSSKKREKKMSTFQKKIAGEIFFRGGIFFRVIFFNFFSFRFFCCVG
jgi:hypothetical protein